MSNFKLKFEESKDREKEQRENPLKARGNNDEKKVLKRTTSDPRFDNVEYLQKVEKDMEKNIDANTKLSLEINDNINVEIILKLANISKNNFLFENLSASNPNNGAINIRIKLAAEFETPRYSVLSDAVVDDAKYSVKIIGKKPASTIVA